MYSSVVQPVLEKPNQFNTLIKRKAAAEKVTLTDPCHPLYEQSFPLLHIKNKQNMVPSALIQLQEGVNRLVPLESTNMAVSPPVVFPLPVDISSLEKLTKIFDQIQAEVKREDSDETRAGKGNEEGDTTRPSLGHIKSETTGDGATDNNPNLPLSGQSVGKGGQQ